MDESKRNNEAGLPNLDFVPHTSEDYINQISDITFRIINPIYGDWDNKNNSLNVLQGKLHSDSLDNLDRIIDFDKYTNDGFKESTITSYRFDFSKLPALPAELTYKVVDEKDSEIERSINMVFNCNDDNIVISQIEIVE